MYPNVCGQDAVYLHLYSVLRPRETWAGRAPCTDKLQPAPSYCLLYRKIGHSDIPRTLRG